MMNVTGEVCYRSTKMNLKYNNYYNYYLKPFNGSTITFETYPANGSDEIQVEIADIVNFYSKRKATDVVDKIYRDVQIEANKLKGGGSVVVDYDQLWLYLPDHPKGLKGIFQKQTFDFFSIIS